ncbi:sodium/calcium exchanger NCL2-like isoform X2 [Punica granatum]|uniref:Sodium/calcium exchanger NCL2-like isoform X2 n=1 Tax=Punica granatum TaxID=22663 RepID=A0A6P8E5F1_PUNGR|nr:sodium/calcium exchanger NCL2-like isoform X2 [Punica granatum]
MKMKSIHGVSGSILVVSALLLLTVNARPVRHGCSNNHLVRDGIEKADLLCLNQSSDSLLTLRRTETKGANASNESNDGSVCEQMYGFLPCSNSMWGHLFLIVVYEYLLFHGESYVASGSEQIFKLLGPGIFGASAFHVLGALPESLILIASGLLNSEETAQEYVVTGVGLLAGSSILLLTLLWGTCIVLGSRDFSSGMESGPHMSPRASNSVELWIKKLWTLLTGSGVTTDLETSYTARIMAFSVIPFAIIQLEKVFPVPSEQRAVILSTLIISVVLLILYFIYQMFEPWIQKRSLEYVKHEQLILRILQHVQKRTLERLLADDGSPNTDAIRRCNLHVTNLITFGIDILMMSCSCFICRLFEEIDQDKDDRISKSELKELLLEIKFKHIHMNRDRAVEEVIREIDLDGDQMIGKEEFVIGFTKWLEQAKTAMDRELYSKQSFRDLYRVFQPFIQKKKEERELKKHLVSDMLTHMESQSSVGTLLAEDGTPDLPAIKRLFEEMDRDGDNCISQAELKDIMVNVKFGKVPIEVDEAVAKTIEMFDTSGDRVIDEEEFVTGLARWFDTSGTNKEIQTPESRETHDEFYQKAWEETDKLVELDKKESRDAKLWWIWAKSIALLLLGITILAILAEPLIHSVQHFSTSVSTPSFFISFILVPWATNARGAAAAMKAARRKKPRTTSLTFSEIYGGVFMSNVSGLCVLLCLIYARGLTWNFSAEFLVVLIVCAAIGIIASFRSTFPLWTAGLAYLLYPLSLLTVYVLEDHFNYS